MPSLRDIRRRINSVKKTQQITRAMKMVSAAKLQRAQERVVAARPYANKMAEVLANLAVRAKPGVHPLLEDRGQARILLLVITADKGLCGAFNSNLTRAATQFVHEHRDSEVSLVVVGRKGRDFFRRRPEYRVRSTHVNLFQRTVAYETAAKLAREVTQVYLDGETDRVFVLYNEFRSALQQRLTTRQLIPITPRPVAEGELVVDYLYEPSVDAILSALLPRYVEVQVFRALLESVASEHGARMTAMDSATSNAEEMIDRLTLTFNRTRQAAITKEIIEVVSGADALKG
ncbi:MAG: ATP synthase F1 subunit gamma [Nitrospinota bacterium]|nr:MAG: ATP synthase F1 subunit gamma [Nitrospinota bacterium]